MFVKLGETYVMLLLIWSNWWFRLQLRWHVLIHVQRSWRNLLTCSQIQITSSEIFYNLEHIFYRLGMENIIVRCFFVYTTRWDYKSYICYEIKISSTWAHLKRWYKIEYIWYNHKIIHLSTVKPTKSQKTEK